MGEAWGQPGEDSRGFEQLCVEVPGLCQVSTLGGELESVPFGEHGY